MSNIRNRITFKVISIVLIAAFIGADISYAYPGGSEARDALAPAMASPNSLSDGTLADRGQSIRGDMRFSALVRAIADRAFRCEAMERQAKVRALNAMERVLVGTLGEALVGIQTDRINITDDGILLIPVREWADDGKRWLVQVALRGKTDEEALVGHSLDLSDRYIVKLASVGSDPRIGGGKVPGTVIPEFARPAHDLLRSLGVGASTRVISIGPGVPLTLVSNTEGNGRRLIPWEDLCLRVGAQVTVFEPAAGRNKKWLKMAHLRQANRSPDRLRAMPAQDARFDQNGLEHDSADIILTFSVLTDPTLDRGFNVDGKDEPGFIRRAIAEEIGRVLRQGGHLITGWYRYEGYGNAVDRARMESREHARFEQCMRLLTDQGYIFVKTAEGVETGLGSHKWEAYRLERKPPRLAGPAEQAAAAPVAKRTLADAFSGADTVNPIEEMRRNTYPHGVPYQCGVRTLEALKKDSSLVMSEDEFRVVLSAYLGRYAEYGSALPAESFVGSILIAMERDPTLESVLFMQLGARQDSLYRLEGLLMLFVRMMTESRAGRIPSRDELEAMRGVFRGNPALHESVKLAVLNAFFAKDPALEPTGEEIALYRRCLASVNDNARDEAVRMWREFAKRMDIVPLLAAEGIPEPDRDAPAGSAVIDSYDGAAEELMLEDRALYNLIFDPENTRRVLAIAAALRGIYPYTETLKVDGLRGTLEESIAKGVYFRLADGIYISPATDSFRRHIIFRMDANKNITRALEIKIPGEMSADKRIVSREDIGIAREVLSKYPGLPLVRPVAFMTLPGKAYELYGSSVEFDPADPDRSCNIAVFEYEDGRRLNNIRASDIEAIAGRYERYAGDTRKAVKDILSQVMRIVAALHTAGYAGHNEDGSDMHLANFRVIFGERGPKVMFVDDFGAFRKMAQDDGSKIYADLDGLMRMSGQIEGLDEVFGAHYLSAAEYKAAYALAREDVFDFSGALKEIKAAAFDWDGTISRLREGWQGIMIPVIAAIISGQEVSEDDWKKCVESIKEGGWDASRFTSPAIEGLLGDYRIDPVDINAAREYVMLHTGDPIPEYFKHAFEGRAVRGGTMPDGPEALEAAIRRCVKRYTDAVTELSESRVARFRAGELGPEDVMFLPAVRALRYFKARGIPSHVVTGSDAAGIRHEARILGIDRLITEVSGYAVGGTAESKKGIITGIKKRYGCGPLELCVIGDGKIEIEAARAKEIDALAVGLRTPGNDTVGGWIQELMPHLFIDHIELDNVFPIKDTWGALTAVAGAELRDFYGREFLVRAGSTTLFIYIEDGNVRWRRHDVSGKGPSAAPVRGEGGLGTVITAGRSRGNVIVIPDDPEVSRRHFDLVVTTDGDDCRLRIVNHSRNKTYCAVQAERPRGEAPAAKAMDLQADHDLSATRKIAAGTFDEMRNGNRQSLVGSIPGLTPVMEEVFRTGRIYIISDPIHRGDYKLLSTAGGETFDGAYDWDDLGFAHNPAIAEKLAAYEAFREWERREVEFRAGNIERAREAFAAEFGKYGVRLESIVRAEEVYFVMNMLRFVPERVFSARNAFGQRILASINFKARRNQSARYAQYNEDTGEVGIIRNYALLDKWLIGHYFMHELGHAVHAALSDEERRTFREIFEAFTAADAFFATNRLGLPEESRISYIRTDPNDFFAENFMHMVMLSRGEILDRKGKPEDKPLRERLVAFYEGIGVEPVREPDEGGSDIRGWMGAAAILRELAGEKKRDMTPKEAKRLDDIANIPQDPTEMTRVLGGGWPRLVASMYGAGLLDEAGEKLLRASASVRERMIRLYVIARYHDILEHGCFFHGSSIHNLEGIKQHGLDQRFVPPPMDEVERINGLYRKYFKSQYDKRTDNISLAYQPCIALNYGNSGPETLNFALQAADALLIEARIAPPDREWVEAFRAKWSAYLSTHMPMLLAIPVKTVLPVTDPGIRRRSPLSSLPEFTKCALRSFPGDLPVSVEDVEANIYRNMSDDYRDTHTYPQPNIGPENIYVVVKAGNGWRMMRVVDANAADLEDTARELRRLDKEEIRLLGEEHYGSYGESRKTVEFDLALLKLARDAVIAEDTRRAGSSIDAAGVAPASILGPGKAITVSWWLEELLKFGAYAVSPATFALYNTIFVLAHYNKANINTYVADYRASHAGRSPPAMRTFFAIAAAPLLVTAVSVAAFNLIDPPAIAFGISAAAHLAVNVFALDAGLPPASAVKGGTMASRKDVAVAVAEALVRKQEAAGKSPDSSVPDALAGRIRSVLIDRGYPEPDKAAGDIAREIFDYSRILASFTATREVMVSGHPSEPVSSWPVNKLSVKMPIYLKAIGHRDLDNQEIFLEKGVGEVDIREFFIGLLAIRKIEKKEDIAFPALGEGRVAVIRFKAGAPGYYRYSLLVRSRANAERKSGAITPRMRAEYQRLIRAIGYAVYNLHGAPQVAIYANFELNNKLSGEQKRALRDIFDMNWPGDVLMAIQSYTYSPDQLTGMEDDALLMERLEGWRGALDEAMRLFEAHRRMVQEMLRQIGVEGDDAEKEMLGTKDSIARRNDFIRILLSGDKLANKAFVDLARYQGETYKPVSGILNRVQIVPGTRLWLDDFLLDNIIREIYYNLSSGRKLDITLSEMSGYTVLHVTYEDGIRPGEVFGTNTKGMTYAGLLISDIVGIAGGTMAYESSERKSQLTIRFPLPQAEPGHATNRTTTKAPEFGPALFVDEAGSVRELDAADHDRLNAVLGELAFDPANAGYVERLKPGDVERLVGGENFEKIKARAPPHKLAVHVIDDKALSAKLPDDLVRGLITHAGTYRVTLPDGTRGPAQAYNLFIPRSVYKILRSYPEQSAELAFWRRHEIGHILDREARAPLDAGEAALAKSIRTAAGTTPRVITGAEVRSLAELDALADFPMDTVEIVPEAFPQGEKLFVWDPALQQFNINGAVASRIAETARNRKLSVVVRYPSAFDLADGTRLVWSITAFNEREMCYRYFDAVEKARAEYGLGDAITVTFDPFLSVLTEGSQFNVLRLLGVDARTYDAMRNLPVVKDFVESGVLPIASTFLYTLDERINGRKMNVRVAVEYRQDKSTDGTHFTAEPDKFMAMLKNTSGKIQFAFAVGTASGAEDHRVFRQLVKSANGVDRVPALVRISPGSEWTDKTMREVKRGLRYYLARAVDLGIPVVVAFDAVSYGAEHTGSLAGAVADFRQRFVAHSDDKASQAGFVDSPAALLKEMAVRGMHARNTVTASALAKLPGVRCTGGTLREWLGMLNSMGIVELDGEHGYYLPGWMDEAMVGRIERDEWLMQWLKHKRVPEEMALETIRRRVCLLRPAMPRVGDYVICDRTVTNEKRYVKNVNVALSEGIVLWWKWVIDRLTESDRISEMGKVIKYTHALGYRTEASALFEEALFTARHEHLMNVRGSCVAKAAGIALAIGRKEDEIRSLLAEAEKYALKSRDILWADTGLYEAGSVFAEMGDADEAGRLFRKFCDMALKQDLTKHDRAVISMLNKAVRGYGMLGRIDEAKKIIDRIYEIAVSSKEGAALTNLRRTSAGPNEIKQGDTERGMATEELIRGLLDADRIEDALKVTNETAWPGEFIRSIMLSNIIMRFIAKGELDRVFDDDGGLIAGILPGERYSLWRIYPAAAVKYLEKGDINGAMKMKAALLATRPARQKEDPERMSGVYRNYDHDGTTAVAARIISDIAVWLVSHGRRPEAEKLADEMMAIIPDISAEGNDRTWYRTKAEAFAAAADALDALGRREEARLFVKEARDLIRLLQEDRAISGGITDNSEALADLAVNRINAGEAGSFHDAIGGIWRSYLAGQDGMTRICEAFRAKLGTRMDRRMFSDAFAYIGSGLPCRRDIMDRYFESRNRRSYIADLKERAASSVSKGFNPKSETERTLAFYGVNLSGIDVPSEDFDRMMKGLSQASAAAPDALPFGALFTDKGYPTFRISKKEGLVEDTSAVDTKIVNEHAAEILGMKSGLLALEGMDAGFLERVWAYCRLKEDFAARPDLAQKYGGMTPKNVRLYLGRHQAEASESGIRQYLAGLKEKETLTEAVYFTAHNQFVAHNDMAHVELMLKAVVADALLDVTLEQDIESDDTDSETVAARLRAINQIYTDRKVHIPHRLGLKLHPDLVKRIDTFSQGISAEIEKVVLRKVSYKQDKIYEFVPAKFLGVFRGMAGEDCSDDEDKGKPYTRALHEDTIYYIVYTNGKVSGYVGLMEAECDKGRVLTVDTMQPVPPQIVGEITEKLNDIALSKGFIGVALPSNKVSAESKRSALTDAFNYTDVQDAVTALPGYQRGDPITARPIHKDSWAALTKLFGRDEYNTIENGNFVLYRSEKKAPSPADVVGKALAITPAAWAMPDAAAWGPTELAILAGALAVAVIVWHYMPYLRNLRRASLRIKWHEWRLRRGAGGRAVSDIFLMLNGAGEDAVAASESLRRIGLYRVKTILVDHLSSVNMAGLRRLGAEPYKIAVISALEATLDNADGALRDMSLSILREIGALTKEQYIRKLIGDITHGAGRVKTSAIDGLVAVTPVRLDAGLAAGYIEAFYEEKGVPPEARPAQEVLGVLASSVTVGVKLHQIRAILEAGLTTGRTEGMEALIARTLTAARVNRLYEASETSLVPKPEVPHLVGVVLERPAPARANAAGADNGAADGDSEPTASSSATDTTRPLSLAPLVLAMPDAALRGLTELAILAGALAAAAIAWHYVPYLWNLWRLKDGSPEVRAAAVQAMADMGGERAVFPLLYMLADRVPAVRLAAIGTMGKLLTPLRGRNADLFAFAVSCLAVKLVDERIGNIRAVIASQLCSFGKDTAADAVRDGLRDDVDSPTGDWTNLSNVRAAVTAAFEELLLSRDAGHRDLAAAVLKETGELTDERNEKKLRGDLEYGTGTVRMRAIEGLSATGRIQLNTELAVRYIESFYDAEGVRMPARPGQQLVYRLAECAASGASIDKIKRVLEASLRFDEVPEEAVVTPERIHFVNENADKFDAVTGLPLKPRYIAETIPPVLVETGNNVIVKRVNITEMEQLVENMEARKRLAAAVNVASTVAVTDEQAKAAELFGIVDGTINNRRARLERRGNGILDLLSGLRIVSDTGRIDRTASTFEMRGRLDWALRAAANFLEDSADVGPDETAAAAVSEISAAEKLISKEIDMLEPDSVVASIILLAEKAESEGKDLIIGVDTSWIRGARGDNSPRDVVVPLLGEIYRLGGKFRPMGLNNIKVVHGEKDDMLRKVEAAMGEAETDASNVVILAAKDFIDSTSMNWLRGKPGRRGAFFAGIDPSLLDKFYEENGKDPSVYGYIDILELLSVALELATGKEMASIPMNGIYYGENRTVIFMPNPEKMDYEELRNRYLAGRDALAAA